MKRARLIMNPVSGDEQPNTAKLLDIVAALEAAEIRTDLTFTSPERSATEIAQQATQEDYDLVIVSGGDGTVSQVAKGLLHSSLPLGILPIGTYNNIARSLNLPTDLTEACQVLAHGQVKAIDVGVVNDRHYFFEAAGIGLDAALFPVGEEIKEGRWARFFQAAQLAIRFKPQRISILLDRPIGIAKLPLPNSSKFRSRRMGRRELRFSVLLMVVANGPFYGAGFTVAPDAGIDDGLLTISVFRKFSKWDLLRHFWTISQGQYHYSPRIETYQVEELQVSAPNANLQVHVDGCPIGELPATFKVLKQGLHVFVPPTPASNTSMSTEQATLMDTFTEIA